VDNAVGAVDDGLDDVDLAFDRKVVRRPGLFGVAKTEQSPLESDLPTGRSHHATLLPYSTSRARKELSAPILARGTRFV